uniref:Uncharacterized protein n=1 Tax=Tanacetum cinerariifolium TaxID=118510 RepID=A0A6L2JN22_TANCI|nr:hypothetical protein [Tanacetum cinerariifolium]
MDSLIPRGQNNTLAEYMILYSANNHPSMLDKDLYDSSKSQMELYMQNREYERMILKSVENGPLIWPTFEENKVTRTKKYAELSAAKKIQADCDLKATDIIFQGLPGDDLIACLNKVDKQGLLHATFVKVKDIWLGNALSLSDKGMQHAIRIKLLLIPVKQIFA